MEKLTDLCCRIFGHRYFYWAILAFFVLEASWIALSARYPMAFDENYHFGLIKLYAHQLSPFFAHEPTGASVFGDVTRYPSYLFHYLLSFPYRLIARLTSNVADQIVALRFISIVLFLIGLILWRKFFEALKVSAALSNFALLVFVLLPQIPFLAGQINYDNLLVPLVAGALLLTVQIRQRKLGLSGWLWLLVLCWLASLVKYTFLPIFAGSLVYFLVLLGRGQLVLRPKRQPRLLGVVLLVIFLSLAGGLFIERYGGNVIRFHTPVPDCGQVIGVDPCLDYGPWARNYHYEQARASTFSGNALVFTGVWAYRLWQQPFVVLRQDYYGNGGYALPELAVAAVSLIGLIGLALNGKKLVQSQPYFWLILAVVGFYLTALWLLNYREYLHYQRYVAIQARYLFPLLPLIFILFGRSLQLLLPRQVLGLLALLVLVLLLSGGGLSGYVNRSDRSWWWQQATVIRVNEAAQRASRPLQINWVFR